MHELGAQAQEKRQHRGQRQTQQKRKKKSLAHCKINRKTEKLPTVTKGCNRRPGSTKRATAAQHTKITGVIFANAVRPSGTVVAGDRQSPTDTAKSAMFSERAQQFGHVLPWCGAPTAPAADFSPKTQHKCQPQGGARADTEPDTRKGAGRPPNPTLSTVVANVKKTKKNRMQNTACPRSRDPHTGRAGRQEVDNHPPALPTPKTPRDRRLAGHVRTLRKCCVMGEERN